MLCCCPFGHQSHGAVDLDGYRDWLDSERRRCDSPAWGSVSSMGSGLSTIEEVDEPRSWRLTMRRSWRRRRLESLFVFVEGEDKL